MDNESHFNVTRGACFESIEFRGDYGMVADEATNDPKRNFVYCCVDEESDLFSYGAIQLYDSNGNSYDHADNICA